MHAHELSADQAIAGQLADVVERLLRPIIRLFVGRISCDYMVRTFKRLYIEEAKNWIERQGDVKVTKSRLALLTGLDSRTIAAIEEQSRATGEDESVSPTICPEASVIGRWSNDPEYHDENGAPDMLPILGKPRTFQTLVTPLVGRSVTAQTVLQRLLDSGNVELVDEDHVQLIDRHYKPMRASEASILTIGSWSIVRLLETIRHNLEAADKADRLLQQNRYSIYVRAQDLEQAKQDIRALLDRQIGEVERLLERYECSKERARTLGVGWFVFV